jgi:solute carrier family 35 protein E1
VHWPPRLSPLPLTRAVRHVPLQEPSFNWSGFLFALGSNLTFQSRNVLSKRLLAGAKGLQKARVARRALLPAHCG